ncbi:MAG: MBL fold metallo-hydrolase [Rhodospirillales bacterium]|nr:MBL fold metallo-hydrolase [Rhodospirillales bacterium]
MRMTILGSGSSSGTPGIDFGWGRCDPKEPRNRRSRPSVLVESGDTRLLVDTPPDLRQQLIAAGVKRLDGVLFTHSHADHLHGVDDLRPVNRHMKAPIRIYTDAKTLAAIRARFGYVLEPLQGTLFYKPMLIPIQVVPGTLFRAGSIDVMPMEQDHGLGGRTLGFRFGPIAYSTDVLELSDKAFEDLAGVEVWVVNVLSADPHPTHAHVDKALNWIKRVKPRLAVMTGLGPGLDYGAMKARLPQGIEPAYDGMIVEANG